MLTVEQKKLVEENERFIYYVLKRLCLPIEDYYGAAAIGICKAAKSYDPSRGYTFATWAWNCMKNECFMERRAEKRRDRPYLEGFSLDQPSFNNDGDMVYPQIASDDSFSEWIEDTEDESHAAEIYSKAQKKMTEKEKAAFKLFLVGRTQNDIARDIGTSRSYVSRLIEKAKTKCSRAAV